MVTELSKWAYDAKKWREENGYTTPEWEMYVKNRNVEVQVTSIVCLVVGVVAGYLLQ